MLMGLQKQRGATLVELMVSMVISLLVISGVTYVFIGNSDASIYQVRATRYVEEMRSAMDRMVRDIRRAGYAGYRSAGSPRTVVNPFAYQDWPSSKNTDIQAGTNVASNDCVLFAYNRNDDNPPYVGCQTNCSWLGDYADTAGTSNELFGYRLNNNQVQMLGTGDGSKYSCTASGSAWSSMTDSTAVSVTGLTFAVDATDCKNASDSAKTDCTSSTGSTADDPDTGNVIVVTRKVTISMTGVSPYDSTLTTTLTQSITLPNDYIYTWP